MSKMAELAYDIEQLYIEGKNVGQIARELNCPKSIVLDWIADQGLDILKEHPEPFETWSPEAQQRLIEDINPYNTINS